MVIEKTSNTVHFLLVTIVTQMMSKSLIQGALIMSFLIGIGLLATNLLMVGRFL